MRKHSQRGHVHTHLRDHTRTGKAQVHGNFYQKCAEIHSYTDMPLSANQLMHHLKPIAMLIWAVCTDEGREAAALRPRGNRSRNFVMTPLRSPHGPLQTCSLCLDSDTITLNTPRLQHHRYCMGEGWDFPQSWFNSEKCASHLFLCFTVGKQNQRKKISRYY